MTDEFAEAPRTEVVALKDEYSGTRFAVPDKTAWPAVVSLDSVRNALNDVSTNHVHPHVYHALHMLIDYVEQMEKRNAQ